MDSARSPRGNHSAHRDADRRVGAGRRVARRPGPRCPELERYARAGSGRADLARRARALP